MVTQESDPALWSRLYAQWIEEGRPAYLATGTTSIQYQVHQLTSGEIGFELQSEVENMYNQSSLRGMKK